MGVVGLSNERWPACGLNHPDLLPLQAQPVLITQPSIALIQQEPARPQVCNQIYDYKFRPMVAELVAG